MDSGIAKVIDDKWEAYRAATQSRDKAQLMSLWAPEARFLEPGIDLSGSDLHAFMEDFWENGGEVFEFKIETMEVFDHGDTAYQIAQYDETFRFPGGERTSVQHYGFFRWEKQPDGEWRVHRVVAGPRHAQEEG